VLELHDISFQLGKPPREQLLLTEVNASFPTTGHLAAVLGPSGCGKSTLLKVIAGLREQTLGWIVWEGRDLAKEGDLEPHEIGYVPQFSIAYDLLTVRESVTSALLLRVVRGSTDERVAKILSEVGLEEIADRQVRVLSGGQRRRLALALEMVSSPRLLLCDEVTSGLDPKAEDEITHLLHQLSRDKERLVLHVTHSLRHLSLCDSVLVLFEGHVAYHGAADFLFHYFGVERHEDLFPQLARRPAQEWHRSWLKHRQTYYVQSGLTGHPPPDTPLGDEGFGVPGSEARKARVKLLLEQIEREKAEAARRAPTGAPDKPSAAAHSVVVPSAVTQFRVLLARRLRLFFRDRGQLLLQLALLLGFPCLVAIFALDGLPQLKGLAAPSGGDLVQQFKGEISQLTDRMRTGSLVSGLVMFQVILLALIASNNAAREIAGERLILEKEKFAGLSPLAYVSSKAAFLGLLVLAQSVWMGLFVHWIVRFPGSLAEQILLLTLVNAAVTAVCLGISSLARSADQASLVSIYLVGFQLPLSGAVLALPSVVEPLVRPFIASYWGWSGFIRTLRETRFYEAILLVSQTQLSAVSLCCWVLASHVVVGLYLAWIGSRKARWE
jgi:ABC transport system ATP-binding/permease protein